jgi:hypothetical protein
MPKSEKTAESFTVRLKRSVSLCMKSQWGSGKLYSFLTPTLDGDERLVSLSGRFTPEKGRDSSVV